MRPRPHGDSASEDPNGAPTSTREIGLGESRPRMQAELVSHTRANQGFKLTLTGPPRHAMHAQSWPRHGLPQAGKSGLDNHEATRYVARAGPRGREVRNPYDPGPTSCFPALRSGTHDFRLGSPGSLTYTAGAVLESNPNKQLPRPRRPVHSRSWCPLEATVGRGCSRPPGDPHGDVSVALSRCALRLASAPLLGTVIGTRHGA